MPMCLIMDHGSLEFFLLVFVSGNLIFELRMLVFLLLLFGFVFQDFLMNTSNRSISNAKGKLLDRSLGLTMSQPKVPGVNMQDYVFKLIWTNH